MSTDARQKRQREFAFGILVPVLFLSLHLLAPLLQPPFAFWGMDLLRYLPAYAYAVPIAGIVLIIAWRLLSPKPGPGRAPTAALAAIAVGTAALLVASNIDTFILGDGENVLNPLIGAMQGIEVSSRAPLAFFLLKAAYRVADLVLPSAPQDTERLVSDLLECTFRERANAEFAFTLTGLLFAALLFAAAYRTVRVLFPPGADRIPAFLLVLFAGTLAQFAGYVELYALPVAAIVVLHLALLECLAGRWHPAAPVAAFVFAATAHFGAVIYAPPLIYVLIARTRGRRWMAAAMLASIPALLLVVSWLLGFPPAEVLEILFMRSTRYGTHLIPLFTVTMRSQSYTAFSPYHFLDIANLLLLVQPFGIIALAALAPRALATRLAGDTRGRMLVLSAACSAAMIFAFNCELAMFTDWDLLSPYTIPIVLAAFHLLATAERPAARAWFLRSAAIALVIHTGLWLWVLADDTATVERMRSTQNAVTFSPDGRWHTTMHLTRHFSETGDEAAALRALRRLTGELSPDDPRGYFTLARLHSRMGDRAQALATLGAAEVRGALDYRGAEALGDLVAQRGDYERAIRLYRVHFATAPASYRDSARIGMTWLRLGFCLLRADSAAQSIDALRQSLRYRAGDIEAESLLAQQLILVGRCDEARPVLLRILARATDERKRKGAALLLERCGGQ